MDSGFWLVDSLGRVYSSMTLSSRSTGPPGRWWGPGPNLGGGGGPLGPHGRTMNPPNRLYSHMPQPTGRPMGASSMEEVAHHHLPSLVGPVLAQREAEQTRARVLCKRSQVGSICAFCQQVRFMLPSVLCDSEMCIMQTIVTLK